MFEGWGAAAVGAAVVGGVASSRAASKAAGAQGEASEAGIAEERRQFDKVQELLKPYVDAGTGAVGGQSDLLGLNGPDKEAAAIAAIKNSPEFASLTEQGEEGILQNASATGGLRGGNVQGALAQFRPSLLSSLIESRFNKLGSVAGLGQASATGTASAAQNTGNNIAGLLAQEGQAKAGGYLAQGAAIENAANSFGTFSLLKSGLLKDVKVF